jgi:hypothetical protein
LSAVPGGSSFDEGLENHRMPSIFQPGTGCRDCFPVRTKGYRLFVLPGIGWTAPTAARFIQEHHVVKDRKNEQLLRTAEFLVLILAITTNTTISSVPWNRLPL